MEFIKKYYQIIIPIIIAIVVACGFVVFRTEKQQKPINPPVEIQKEEVPAPVETKQKPEPEEPVMRDENDMPKSDVNVPEIG